MTISHCIIAEGLDHSTHGKGAHSKGSLIHDNATDIAVIANLYASNGQRNPYFKGGARGVVVNNLIDNPGSAAIHYGLQLGEWGLHPWVSGQIAIMGNVMNHGPNTKAALPLFSTNGTPCEVFLKDNLAVDRAGNPVRLTAGAHGQGLTSNLAARFAGHSRQRRETVRPGQRRSSAVGSGRRRLPHHPASPRRQRQDSGQRAGSGRLPDRAGDSSPL